jgi:hypothetical protein
LDLIISPGSGVIARLIFLEAGISISSDFILTSSLCNSFLIPGISPASISCGVIKLVSGKLSLIFSPFFNTTSIN